jgi:acid phosphatase
MNKKYFLVVLAAAGILTLNYCSVQETKYEGYTGKSKVIHAQPIPPFTVSEKKQGVRYLPFLAFGDFGTGKEGQKMIADAMAQKAKTDSAAFLLALGDNFYEFGVQSTEDNQWKIKFEDMYDQPSLHIPFYAVLGNHDHRGNSDAQVEYSKISSRWRMPAKYYTFNIFVDDSAAIQFFALDTDPINDQVESAKAQLAWLEMELKKSSARWKIAFGHHPIYSGGEHGDNKIMKAALENLLMAYKVDLYLTGHDHDQEIITPVNGVLHIVSGAGGKDRDVTWSDRTIYAGTNLGFTWFRISRNEMLVEFITGKNHLDFAYTVIK